MGKIKGGNLRFRDKELLPWYYRQKFLHYTEKEAPEVLADLKKLCPKYHAVINDYPFTNHLTSFLNGEDVIDPSTADSHKRELLDYHLAVKDRYQVTNLADLPNAEETAWWNCIELRSAFTQFRQTYGLTNDWLREGLFRLLGDLNRSPRHFNSLCYVYSHSWLPVHGEEIELRVFGWKIEESWQEFVQRANEQFQYELKKHKSETIKFFSDYRYKKATKPLSFEPVKWLVWWTVKRMSKQDILDRIDKERDYEGKPYDLKSLEHHFRQLKRYELPVRKG